MECILPTTACYSSAGCSKRIDLVPASAIIAADRNKKHCAFV